VIHRWLRAPATKFDQEKLSKSTTINQARRNPGYFFNFLRQKRDNRELELSQKMPRKRSEAAPAKTGRTWSPIKGLTLTERGRLQVQARVRRTGRPSQTKTFENVAEAEAWGLGVFDGFNRNAFVDRRREKRTTLADALEQYKQTGLTVLKSRVQARSQVDQLLKSLLAQRFVGEIESADVIAWPRERRAATVRRKRRDAEGRVARIKKGRRLEIQREEVPIGEKTVLNELMRLSAAFVFARVEMKMRGLRNPVEDVPVKDKPKRRERTRRLRGDEEERLLAAPLGSRESRPPGLGIKRQLTHCLPQSP